MQNADDFLKIISATKMYMYIRQHFQWSANGVDGKKPSLDLGKEIQVIVGIFVIFFFQVLHISTSQLKFNSLLSYWLEAAIVTSSTPPSPIP